jgi:ABC-type nitrate/sulfonate/bicarbonate transport system substrate-binding protein
MRKIIAIIPALMILISLAHAGKLPVVKYVDFKVYDATYIGLEKGFFKKHGIDVQLYGSLLGGPTAIQAVSAGRCNIGLSFLGAIINANNAGMPIYGICDIQSAIGTQPLEEYFVKNDSPIKTISDLKGKKFAVNLWKASFQYTAIMALAKAGLKPEDVNFILLPFDKQIMAIQNGDVDVVGLMEPYASKLRETGGYRVLFNALDIFGQKQFTVQFVNRVWAENNPKTVRAFVAGIQDSIDWMKKNPAETKKIMAKYTLIDEKYIPAYTFQKDAGVVTNDVVFWLDYMRTSGAISNTWLKPEDIAGNIYNLKIK